MKLAHTSLRRNGRHKVIWRQFRSSAEFVALRAVQVLGVGPANQRQTLGGPEQPVDGGIAQFPGARRTHALLRRQAVQHVQYPAMGHQHNLLAKMV